jgi:hypothetical protein
MNGIVSFRLLKLDTPALLEKVDAMTDEMFKEQKVPARHIPARPDADYDLLVGELVKRMQDAAKLLESAAGLVGNPGTNISSSTDIACDNWHKEYEAFVLLFNNTPGNEN